MVPMGMATKARSAGGGMYNGNGTVNAVVGEMEANGVIFILHIFIIRKMLSHILKRFNGRLSEVAASQT